MIMNLSKYRINHKFITDIYKREKDRKELGSIVSECALATGVPCVIVAYFLGEIIGFTPEVNKIIENLKSFYGYTSIEE